MIKMVRTNSENHDFIDLVKLLDADLAKRDGEDHSFYAQFNKVDQIKHVVVAYEDEKPSGCGAIKEYVADTMEIKRMYVLPESRKKGIALRILAELETWAGELSCPKCILETGNKQPEAIGLYKRNGYKLIPNYGQYVAVENSVCFEKEMRFKPVFPTRLHQEVAELVTGFFSTVSKVDTVLVVNSCARGQAAPESDLDFAIMLKPETTPAEKKEIETAWQTHSEAQPALRRYRQSSPFAQLHLDLVDGIYTPALIELGAGPDTFELQVGNQIRYSAPMGEPGDYFLKLENEWLPYYGEGLRLQRLSMAHDACAYDLDHIPFFLKRELYFQAFDTLYRAFQEYLQTLFIANRTYPIAYNKWIKQQIAEWLGKPDLYRRLAPILSVRDLESDQIGVKATMLRELLDNMENYSRTG